MKYLIGSLSFLLVLFIFVIGSLLFSRFFYHGQKEISNLNPDYKFSAFLRVKNEINTIEACLNSIETVFDRIVIIHSNEKDDGTNALMAKWCAKRVHCEIHEYPYEVIPQHDPRLKGRVDPKNTLAAYYNFGLGFFHPEEWIVKIDADQIYMTEKLKQALGKIKSKIKENDRYHFFLTGWDTFVKKDELVLNKERPLKGIDKDQFIVKQKYLYFFKQGEFWEKGVFEKLKHVVFFEPVFFHFADKKYMENDYKYIRTDDLSPSFIKPLNKRQIKEYNKYILPLLIKTNSPFKNLKLERQ